ncbi:MAG: ATP-dependent Clp protease adapter ClpS [Verrucomicrobiales bacterium]|nr:ATP-dependent Clp protease adapter ClpS [Verrucomicrobiales bacterium]
MPNDPGTTILLDPETATDLRLTTPWQVVVQDDPVNLMGFVTMVFRRVFGYSEDKATQLMLEVHHLGESIVWTGQREKAEFYVAQLQGYQLRATLRKAS